MKLLFVKPALAWPRASGHDVYTYHTMKACAALGHEVSLAVASEAEPRALEGLTLASYYCIASDPATNGRPHPATWLQAKFRGYFGVPDSHLTGIAKAVASCRPDGVVVVGLNALPYFAALSGVTRVWFAADELAWHHLSQVSFRDGELFDNLRAAAVKAAYERAHRALIDRAWVVSDTERRAMRWLAGMKTVDVLPLGVDAEYFAPTDERVSERTAVFWGRLDFGPNVQALDWFCERVWPLIRERHADARFTIVGFNPTAQVRRLSNGSGISLLADVPDLRPIARQHAVAVFPFVSGGGMKNKLLEAAALAMPIACTPLATSGLQLNGTTPLAIAQTPAALADRIVALWADDAQRRQLGAQARSWVVAHHSWEATARRAVAAVEQAKADARH